MEWWATLRSLWGQIWVIRATLEAYVSHFDVEEPKMAYVRAICGGLVGPKSGNVENVLVFKAFLKVESVHRSLHGGRI